MVSDESFHTEDMSAPQMMFRPLSLDTPSGPSGGVALTYVSCVMRASDLSILNSQTIRD